jgi:hypothetical protein
MPRAFFDITPELLVEICKGLGPPKNLRAFRVTDDAVPADAAAVTASIAPFGNVRISFESAYVDDGQQLTPTLSSEVVESVLPQPAGGP